MLDECETIDREMVEDEAEKKNEEMSYRLAVYILKRYYRENVVEKYYYRR